MVKGVGLAEVAGGIPVAFLVRVHGQLVIVRVVAWINLLAGLKYASD